MRKRIAHRRLLLCAAASTAVAMILASCGSGVEDDTTAGADEPTSNTGAEYADAGFADGDTLTLVTATSPGGGFDTNLRVIAPYLEQELRTLTGHDVRVAVQNTPGAQQRIGIEAVANADPDGKTIGLLPLDIMAGHQVLNNAAVDMTELTYAGLLTISTKAVMVREDLELPDRSFLGLVERSQEQPILWGQAGSANAFRLMIEQLRDADVQLQIDEVAFPSSSEMIASLLRGEIEAVWTTTATLIEAAEANPEFEVLVQTSCERTLSAPDVPTIVEQDVPAANEVCETADRIPRVFAGPPEIPAETTELLTVALEAAITNQDHVAEAESTGFEISYEGPDKNAEAAQQFLDTYTAYQERIQ